MSKTYNQLTSKLEKKDVNGHTVTMKGSGCGVCSLASIAYNIKTSYTLEKVWEYMVKKGYTIREGTTRTGMTECIKYYGMKSTYYTSTLSGGANLHHRQQRQDDHHHTHLRNAAAGRPERGPCGQHWAELRAGGGHRVF